MPTAARALLTSLALPDRRARLVWRCVACGGLGAEIFSLSVVFYVVRSAGAGGAYYLVPQLLAASVSGLVGAGLLDRFQPLRIALGAELIRVVGALTAYLTVVLNGPVWMVVAQAILVSAVRPHHDSGIMGGLARMGIDKEALKAASALVDNTFRLARIVGPGLVAGLSAVLGSKAGFLLAAIFFLLALIQFIRLDLMLSRMDCEVVPAPTTAWGFMQSMGRAAQLVRRSRLLLWCTVAQAVNTGAWYLGFVFSVALLLSNHNSASTSSSFSSFGVATLAYGLGNVVSGFVVAARPIESPIRYLMSGRIVAALGYFLIASSSSQLIGLSLSAAVTAAGTPMADLAFLKILQFEYEWEDVRKLYRFKMVCEYLGMLAAMSCGPFIIEHAGVRAAVVLCGLALVMTALIGLVGLSPRFRSLGQGVA